MPRHALRAEPLEPRRTPDAFTLRALDHPAVWSDPRSWSDDPAATAVPGPGDTVTVGEGSHTLDLGGQEVVVDFFNAGGYSLFGLTTSLTITNGTLRARREAKLGGDSDTDTLPLNFQGAGLTVGTGPAGPAGGITSTGGYLGLKHVSMPFRDVTVGSDADLVDTAVRNLTVTRAGPLPVTLTGGAVLFLTNSGTMEASGVRVNDGVRNTGTLTLRRSGLNVQYTIVNAGTLEFRPVFSQATVTTTTAAYFEK